MKTSPAAIASLEEVLKHIAPEGVDDPKLPPVHAWHPEITRDIGMEIRADGSWWHEGTRFRRERLVKLFARILRKDPDGQIYLVTPYEKVVVHVEDAPFLAVRVDQAEAEGEAQVLVFGINLGQPVVAGPDHPIRVVFDDRTGEPAPYIEVRDGLEAKLTRPVYYELAALAVDDPERPGRMGVWSRGTFFPIGCAE